MQKLESIPTDLLTIKEGSSPPVLTLLLLASLGGRASVTPISPSANTGAVKYSEIRSVHWPYDVAPLTGIDFKSRAMSFLREFLLSRQYLGLLY